MNKTKLQQYQEIQALVQKEARDVATKVYKELATQYGVNKSPIHYHDGVDLPPIYQKDIVNNVKYNLGIDVVGSGSVEIRAVPNLNKLILTGFAANNVSVSPATKRAIVNGNAAFGKCFVFNSSGVVSPTTSITGIKLVQTSNYLYVDSTTLTNNRTGFAPNKLVEVKDQTGATVASLVIDSYEKGLIQLTSVLATDWRMTFSLMIS